MKFTDETRKVVVTEDGRSSFLASRLTSDELKSVLPEDPVKPPTKEEVERISVKTNPKVSALRDMTPDQVAKWVDQSVNDVGDLKDIVKTLAIAVSVLSRQI